jgi:hypothetical protein
MAEQGRIIPKQQIEIVKYEAEIPYSQGTKKLDRIFGKNLSLAEGDPLIGQTLRLTIFNADLKEYLAGKPEGFRFLADIEERDRPDTQYGPDRTIVQVYNQGEPVSKKKQGGGGGGGGYRGRSLEEDIALENVKRRSIEGQTSVAQVGEWLRNPNALTNTLSKEQCDRIVGKYWKAVERGLDNYLADPSVRPTTKPPADSASKTTQRSQEGQGGASKPAAAPIVQKTPVDPVKNLGDLLTRAKKKGYMPADVARILGIAECRDIVDLNDAWAKVEKHTPKTEEVTEASFK